MKKARVSIDALVTTLNVNGLEMMISLGFLSAASVWWSNELGRGRSKAEKFSIVFPVLTLFVIGLVIVLCLISLFLRRYLAYIFTESPEVAKEIKNLSPLLVISILLNFFQTILACVLGSGRKSVVKYAKISCNYPIGIPVGFVLGYVFNMQVKGVWIGMLFATSLQIIALSIITWKAYRDNQVDLTLTSISDWLSEEFEESDDDSQDLS